MKMKDFRQADRVKHLVMGAGVVSSIHNGILTVVYDERDSRGKNAVGEYDDTWFRINDDLLVKI
mgnify:CR=1 FL=1